MIVRAVVAMAMAMVLASPGSGGRHAWTKPHVLVISDAGNPSTLNPHLTQAAQTANLSELTMAWLLRWNEHNQLYPELATEVPSKANGGISDDGRVITYHLRRGVRWSDGASFDASDVTFSTAVVNDRANAETGRLDQVARVDAPDKYTIIVHLKRPDSTFLVSYFSSCCANPSLLPKHLLAKYRSINNAPYNDLPVGIGPFKFERWDRNKQVVLVANPAYWRGRPKLDEVIYKVVPTSEQLLADMQAHRVDLWYQFGGAYLLRITAVAGLNVYRQPSYAYSHFDFNLTHPVVADPNVRRALRLALDRKSLVQRVSHGVGIVQDTIAPLDAPYYSSTPTVAYDPVAANALLDAAGWKRGADGIRAKNGVRLDVRFAVSAGQRATDDLLELVRENWLRVGVAMTIHRYPPQQFFAPIDQGGALYSDSWDVISFAWAADPLGNFDIEYGCDQFPPAGQNILRWCDRNAQRALDGLPRHYTQAQRTADVAALVAALNRDVPTIVTSMREDLFAYNSDLKNYHPNNLTPFDNMMEVDI